MTGSPASVEARRAATEAMRQGRVAEAEQLLARAIMATPDDFDLLFLYGTALAQSGKLGLAIQALESARRLAPDNPGVLNNLATALCQSGQLAASLGISSWLLLDATTPAPPDDPNLYVFRRSPRQAWAEITAQIVLALGAAASLSLLPATV
jgi:predicted Zn-dependent protease